MICAGYAGCTLCLIVKQGRELVAASAQRPMHYYLPPTLDKVNLHFELNSTRKYEGRIFLRAGRAQTSISRQKFTELAFLEAISTVRESLP